jgi:hypothetical protein
MPCDPSGGRLNCANGSVTTMYLNARGLTGSISTHLGSLTDLQVIYLYGNTLRGTLPSEIGSLKSILHFNINGNQVSGTIPTQLVRMTNLQYLYLHRNRLFGSLPTDIGRLTDLVSLYVSENRLDGNIPTTIGLLQKVQVLYMFSNLFVGSIPTEIGQMVGLLNAKFCCNQLSGTLPTVIAELPTLHTFYANDNRLHGTISISRPNRTFTGGCDLSLNCLECSTTPSDCSCVSRRADCPAITSPPSSPSPIPTGVCAVDVGASHWWSFDDVTSPFRDVIGNLTPLSVTGALLSTSREGLGIAASFVSAPGRVDYASVPSLVFTEAEALSLLLWFRVPTDGSIGFIVLKDAVFGLQWIGFSSALQMYQGQAAYTSGRKSTWSAGDWHHVALVDQGTGRQWSLFIDGAMDFSGSSSPLRPVQFRSAYPLTFGGYFFEFQRDFFRGQIDDVILVRHAISVESVQRCATVSIVPILVPSSVPMSALVSSAPVVPPVTPITPIDTTATPSSTAAISTTAALSSSSARQLAIRPQRLALSMLLW